jgi:hypothetical protein
MQRFDLNVPKLHLLINVTKTKYHLRHLFGGTVRWRESETVNGTASNEVAMKKVERDGRGR